MTYTSAKTTTHVAANESLPPAVSGCGFLTLPVALVLQSCTASAPSTTGQTASRSCPETGLSDADSQIAIYVDAGAGPSGDGTDYSPYADLQEGLDAVEAGGVVVIRKGTYQGAFEVNRERVRLMGQCRDQVFLVGDHLSDVDPVLNVRADGVQVQGLTVQDGAPFVAIRVLNHRDVAFSDVRIRDSSPVGLWVYGDASVSIEGSVFEGNYCNEGLVEAGCGGLALNSGAEASVIGSTFTANMHAGILAIGSQISVSESTLIDPIPHPIVGAAYGIYGEESSIMLGDGVKIIGSTMAGIEIRGGSLTTNGLVEIANTSASFEGSDGYGICSLYADSADSSIILHEGASLERNSGAAMLADSLTAKVEMNGTTVSENGFGGQATAAIEIEAQHAALSDLTLTDNYGGGIFFKGVLGTDATGQPSSITDSVVDGTQGYGIRISDSLVDIENVQVLGTTAGSGDLDGIGLYLDDSDDITLSNLISSDNAGFGVALRNSTFTGNTVVIENNHGAGLAVIASAGTLDDLTITDTTATPLGWGGYGVYIGLADDDAIYDPPDQPVVIRNAKISNVIRAGVAVTDDLVVELNDLTVDGVMFAEGDQEEQADGILATGGAMVDGDTLDISGSVRCALLYDGASGELSGVRTSDNGCGLVQQQCDAAEPLTLTYQTMADISEGIELCGTTTYEVVPEDPPAWSNDVDAE